LRGLPLGDRKERRKNNMNAKVIKRVGIKPTEREGRALPFLNKYDII
jgi:hypothetical protein